MFWELLVATYPLLAIGQPSITWRTQTIGRSGDWVEAPVFSTSEINLYTEVPIDCPTTTSSPDGTCPLANIKSLTTPWPSDAPSVCDCGSRKIAWRRQEVTSAEYNTMTGNQDDDDVAADDLDPFSTPKVSRWNAIALGYSWDASPDNTVDIVPTIDPGGTIAVGETGSDKIYLSSPATTRGQPCGIVSQDVFQATVVDTEGNIPRLMPSAIPSSLYCELDGRESYYNDSNVVVGSMAENEWDRLLVETLVVIDAVCGCRLGRVAAMLEYSGVYFLNLDYVQTLNNNSLNETNMYATSNGFGSHQNFLDRASYFSDFYHWDEATSYTTPNVFYCREDYAVYWNLLFAFESIYNTVGTPHAVYRDIESITFEFVNTHVDNGFLQWRRFYIAGVDCLWRIASSNATLTDAINPCDNIFGKSKPFLPDVVVGLSIGQLFRGFDLLSICNVTTEDGVWAADQSTSCARDLLWAIASMKRNGDQIAWPAQYSGLKPTNGWNPEAVDLIFDASHSLTWTNGGGGIVTSGATLTSKPSDNIFNFVAETAALYVRLAAYSNVYPTNVDIFDTGTNYSVPSNGAECTADMISGQTRVVVAPVYTNIKPTQILSNDPSTQHCPGVGLTRYYRFDPTNDSIVKYAGVCMVGQTIKLHPCCDDPENTIGHICNSFHDLTQMPTLHCDVTQCMRLGTWEMHTCYNDDNYCSNEDGAYNNYQFCYVSSDTTCVRGNTHPYDGGACGYMAEECIGDQADVPILSNFVGTLYPPVLGSPMLRGLAPRGLYNTHVDTTCGNAGAPTYYSSTLYNPCLLMYPRPAVASVFARGSSLPKNLPYTASFFDADYATIFARYTVDLGEPEVTHTYFPFSSPYNGLETEPWRYIFDSAGSMYGNVLDSPTVGFMALWCTDNTAFDICTAGLVNTDNTTMYTTVAFTPASHKKLVADSGTGDLRTGIAQNTEIATPPSNLISFGNTLVSVYNSMKIQSPSAVTAWATEVVWDNEPFNIATFRTYNLSLYTLPWSTSTTIRFGTAFDLGVKLGMTDIAGIDQVGVTVRNLFEGLTDGSRAALNVGLDPLGCTEYGTERYCSTGCTNWKSGPTVPFYARGWWCGATNGAFPAFGFGS